MNYYEELGIDPTASEDEIARAHRRLAKLMHPDQQVDDAVKRLAETQMRRLNAIVETLTDPVKRRLYDEQLQGKTVTQISGGASQAVAKTAPLPPMTPPPSFVLGTRRIWRALPWWVWSTAGALAMTFAISWMVADYSGGSFENRPTDYVRPKDETENKSQKQADPDRSATTHPQHNSALAALNRILAAMEAEKPAPTAPQPTAKTSVVKADEGKEKEQNAGNLGKAAAPVQSEPLTAPLTSAVETEHASARETKPDEPNPHSHEVANEPIDSPAKVSKAAQPTPAPAVSRAAPAPPTTPTPPVQVARGETAVASATLPAVAKPEPLDPLAGDWVYAPKAPEKVVKGYFPPEFIELRLVSDQGMLHGQYRARYRVTNAPIQPDVSFQVLANAANSKRFSWQSSDGRRGVLKITQVDAQNIEVEWKTTTKSRQPALNVGSATLTRRN